jgi:hypothetical protein
MPDTANQEERLEHLDHEVAELRNGVLELLEEARASQDIDESYAERFKDTDEQLFSLEEELHDEDFDPAALAEIRGAIVSALRSIHNLDESTRLDDVSNLLISAETIRHIIRDAIDGHVTGAETDASAVMEQVHQWLPRTTVKDLAGLLGRSPRQVQRWSKERGAPARRLQLVARLVAILRHGWTEEGVIAWFYRSRPEFREKRPIDLLDDPDREQDLLVAARQGRAQHGS